MDHIDVEAAAVPARSTRGFAENSGAQDHDTSYSMIPTPTNDGKQHENIQRIAHAVTDRLLRCLRVLVQEELHNTEAPLELLVLASSERNALAGAPENSPESQTKLDVRQGNHDNEEERGYRPLHKQVSSGLVEAKDIATNNEDKNSHKQGKIKCNPSQNPGQSGKPVVEYTQRVMKMTQNEIETQNAHRSSFREKWRAERHLSYLEDPWKHLWRRNRTEAEPLFRRCTDDERKGLQLDLIDALYFVPKVHNFRHIPWRGLRTLSCWVSLIGLRLNEICGNSPYPFNDHASGIHSCPAFRHIQILIECIWVCNNTSLPRVGDVLIACYKRAILYQPYFGDGCNRNEASSILRIQLRLVHISIFLVNILYKHQPPGLVKDNDLEEVWLRPLSVVEQAMRHTPSSDVFDAGREPFLTVSDLNLKDLQELGKLKIQWTPYWDEHLKLESRSSMTILRLYWFPTGISEILSTCGLCGGLEEDDRKQRKEEILLTLNLLLTSNCHSVEDLQRRYGQLEAPSWLSLLAHEKLNDTWSPESILDSISGPRLSRFWRDDPEMTRFCFEMTDHLRLPRLMNRDLRRVTYDEYPIYYQRLRNLRCYMDAQQPDGLRGLWRDKRNSNAYYTFWIAVSFGVLSILLGFLALAAAAVQAYYQVTA